MDIRRSQRQTATAKRSCLKETLRRRSASGLRARGSWFVIPAAAAALVACGGSAGSDGGAPPDQGELPPTAITGTVGAPAAPVSLASGEWTADRMCGPRGLRLVIGGGASDAGCGGSGGGASLIIYLSDYIPGVYLNTGPITCLAPPSGKGFYATLSGTGAGSFVSTGGIVLLGFYDGQTAAGTLDVALSPVPVMPADPGSGQLAGSFSLSPCP